MVNKGSVFLILVIVLNYTISEASSTRRSRVQDNSSSNSRDKIDSRGVSKSSRVSPNVSRNLEALRARQKADDNKPRSSSKPALNVPSSAAPVNSNYNDWMPELNKYPTKESIARLKKQEKEQEKLVNKLLKINYDIHTPPRQLRDNFNTEGNKHLPPVYFKSEYVDIAFKAVETDDEEGLRGVLSDPSFLNYQNKDGDTILIHAVQNRAINTARILLAKKALVDVANNRKRTALQYASALGDTLMVRLLLSMGANPYLKDDMDMTALDYATLNQQYQVEDIINKYLEEK